MYRQHFGLNAAPLDKDTTALWDDGALARLEERFRWLLDSPGLGLLTGEPGVGKTAALRKLTSILNPHRYQVIYLAETDFGRTDLYRSLALALGLEPAYRRAQLWRDLKARILEQVDGKNLLPLWIIDEAQNLPVEFFKDFPAFLNFAFDSRDLMTVWLVGHPALAHLLDRAPYAALAGRLQVRVHLKPVMERERFAQLITTRSPPPAARTPCWPTPGWNSCGWPRKVCPAMPGASCGPPCAWPHPKASTICRMTSSNKPSRNCDDPRPRHLIPRRPLRRHRRGRRRTAQRTGQPVGEPLLPPHPRLPGQTATGPVRRR